MIDVNNFNAEVNNLMHLHVCIMYVSLCVFIKGARSIVLAGKVWVLC